MKKYLIGILLALIITANAFPQKQGSELIDSLKSCLPGAKENINKVILLGILSFEYHRFDTDLGIKYGEQSKALAEKLHYAAGIAYAYNYIGTNYSIKGNFPKALDCFMQALNRFTDMGNQSMIATMSNNLGLLYININEPGKAIEYFNKALVINEKLNNLEGQSLNFGNLGVVYSNSREYEKANEYYYKALRIDEKFNDKDAVSRNLANISENNLYMGKYCEALNEGLNSLRISKEINSSYNQANSFSTIGRIYFRLGGDSVNIKDYCSQISSDKTNNLNKAKKYIDSSMSLYKEVNDLQSVSENSLLLSKIYEKLGDYKNALQYYKIYTTNHDSVYSMDNSVKIANIEKTNELKIQDHQIRIESLEIDKKNSQMMMWILASLTIVSMISLYSFFLYKRQRYHEKLNIELDSKNEELIRLNATQNKFFSIIAHDLKSPFQGFLSLTELIAEDAGSYTSEELTELGNGLHKSANNLFRLLKNLLDWTQMQKGFISYNAKELSVTDIAAVNVEHIKTGCEQKGITLVNNIKDSFKVMGDENMINSVLLNLISNAVKFTKRGGTVTINAGQIENKMVKVSISDTGVGMSQSIIDKLFVLDGKIVTKGTEGELSTGLGLLLCKEFVVKNGGNIFVESEEGVGSTFSFTLPGI